MKNKDVLKQSMQEILRTQPPEYISLEINIRLDPGDDFESFKKKLIYAIEQAWSLLESSNDQRYQNARNRFRSRIKTIKEQLKHRAIFYSMSNGAQTSNPFFNLVKFVVSNPNPNFNKFSRLLENDLDIRTSISRIIENSHNPKVRVETRDTDTEKALYLDHQFLIVNGRLEIRISVAES